MNLISQPSSPSFIYPPFLKKGIYQHLFTTLTADETKPGMYWGKAPPHPSWGRLYGAVFVTQALSAALMSTQRPDLYYVHQLQSVFLKGGDEKLPLQLQVTDLKITPNFINKKVEVFQKDQLCFIALIALVSINEAPEPSHSFPLIVSGTKPIDFATLPDPNTLPLAAEDSYDLASSTKDISDYDRSKIRTQIVTTPCLVKWIDRSMAMDSFGKNKPRAPRTTFYVRLPQSAEDTFNITSEFETKYHNMIATKKQLEERAHAEKKAKQQLAKQQQQQQAQAQPQQVQAQAQPQVQQQQVKQVASAKMTPKQHLSLQQQLNFVALTYISDYNMIPMALAPHSFDVFPNNIQFSSLNHNITFLTPHFDLFQDWLIFDTAAPFLTNSRTQLTGTFFTRKGVPVAHVTQECIFRVFEDDVLSKFPNPMNAPGPTLEQIQQVLGTKAATKASSSAKQAPSNDDRAEQAKL